MSETLKNSKKYELKLVSIEELEFTQRSAELLEKLGGKPENFGLASNARYRWELEKDIFSIILEFKFHFFQNPDNPIDQIEALCYSSQVTFHILDLKDSLIVRSVNDFDMDDILERNLVSIAISTTRGMLAVRTMGTIFKNFGLPLLDPKEYLLSKRLKNDIKPSAAE